MEINKLIYKKGYRDFGISAKGVHWNSKESQYKRFEVLTDFIKDDLEKCEIADIGCGYAEYFMYLLNENRLPEKYIGIDCEDWMIDFAKQRFPENRYKIEYIVKNGVFEYLPKKDYYLCSGALNLLQKSEIFPFIVNCYDSSKKGFVFNFLKDNPYNELKVEEYINYCKKICNGKIQTKDGYLENDFTIFLEKEK